MPCTYSGADLFSYYYYCWGCQCWVVLDGKTGRRGEWRSDPSGQLYLRVASCWPSWEVFSLTLSVLQSPWPTHDPPPTAHLTLFPLKPLLGLLAFTSLLPPNCKWLDPSAQLHAFFSYLILLSTGTSEPQIGQTLASRGSCESNLDRIFQILLSQFPYLCRGLIRRTFPETLPEMRGFLPSGQGLPTTLFLCNLDPRDPAWCWAHGKCPIKFGHKRM